MTLDELLLYIRAYRLLLISHEEVWPDPFVTQGIRRALRRHRRGLKVLIAWSDIRTCASPNMHRKYWRRADGQRYECEVCQRLYKEVS